MTVRLKKQVPARNRGEENGVSPLETGDHMDRKSFHARYVAVLVEEPREPRVVWLVNRNGRFEELAPGRDGIFRSEVFPGLWLDPAALLRLDSAALLKTLKRGLASKAHREFVGRLAAGPT